HRPVLANDLYSDLAVLSPDLEPQRGVGPVLEVGEIGVPWGEPVGGEGPPDLLDCVGDIKLDTHTCVSLLIGVMIGVPGHPPTSRIRCTILAYVEISATVSSDTRRPSLIAPFHRETFPSRYTYTPSSAISPAE